MTGPEARPGLHVAAAGERTYDLVSLGECMVELWSDAPLGTAERLRRSFGGDALNALVAAARLGSRTAFITRVGDDPFGSALVDAWRAEGIDTSFAPIVSGTNGVYFISLRKEGEREFSYRRAGSAASRIELGDTDLACIASARMLLLSGITQAVSVAGERATRQAADVARASNVLVAFDPNYRPRLWSEREDGESIAGVQAARHAFASILDRVDVLLPSLPSDSVLWDDAGGAVASLRDLETARAIPLVAAKAGAEGAFLIDRGRVRHVPVRDPIAPLDTTGAGDAWNGAFLHHITAGGSAEDAAAAAHAVARSTLLHRGAIAPDT